MAYKRISPQPVVEGGTGDQSFTAYAVVAGGTTSTNPLQSIASVGTAGQLLTSNGAGALPTFQTAAATTISITGDSGGALVSGSFTFTGGTTGLTFAGAGTTETLGGTLAIANGGTNATSMAVTDGTVYYDGTRLVTTATGTAGQFLRSGGAGVAPAYATLPASSISITGDSGGALTGSAFTFTGGTTGLTFSGAGTTETLTGTLIVANGGTGRATLTNHGVLVGAGTTAITQLSVGTNGQVLLGSTAADPVFATLTSSSLTYTAGAGSLAINITAPVSIANGGTNATSMATTDGVVYYDGTRLVTTSAGTSGQILTSNGAGVAPTYQSASGSVTGPGSSTDRAIATWNGTGGAALFNNSTVKIDSSGRMTNTTQPAFHAYLSANTSNDKTGDGTTYTVIFDSTTSNVGTIYNTATGVFTVPVTGKYLLYSQVTLQNLTIAASTCVFQIAPSAGLNCNNLINPGIVANANGNCSMWNSGLFNLSASDTVTVTVRVLNTTKTIGVTGDGSSGYSTFGGYLVG